MATPRRVIFSKKFWILWLLVSRFSANSISEELISVPEHLRPHIALQFRQTTCTKVCKTWRKLWEILEMIMGSVALSSATHTGHDFGCCLHPAPGSGPVLTGRSQQLTFSHHLFEVWNSHKVFNNSHELSQSKSDCLGIHFLLSHSISLLSHSKLYSWFGQGFSLDWCGGADT